MQQIFSKAVGIDLGTTNSAVAIMNRTDSEVVIHRETRHTLTTPSCVWKDPRSGEIVVGRMAARRVGTTPEPIRSVKRLMGRPTTVRVTDEDMTPEQVSARILAEMKRQIEQDVAQWRTPDARWEVDRAIVTVPAYFDHPNIEATRRAAELAGLEVLDLLHEPTAAACYHCWSTRTNNGTFLVYDFGGGTFDVSIVRCTAGTFEVLGISGNNLLGGDNIDIAMATRIQEYLVEDGYAFDLDLDNDPEDRIRHSRLRSLAEGVKKALSTQEEFMLSDAGTLRDKNGEPVVLDRLLDRSDFEDVARPIVSRTIGYCHDAIALATKEAGITLADIDQIILAGGSTHMPLVRELVTEELCAGARCAEPVYDKVDTIVALGAAIRASAAGGLVTYDADRRVRATFRGTGATGTTNARAAGRVEALTDTIDLTGGHVRLETGEYEDETDLVDNGTFAFSHIPIQPDAESRLTFEVYDRTGERVATIGRSLSHTRDLAPDGRDTTPGKLPKAFVLEVNRGGKPYRKELLPALATLPTSADFEFTHPGNTEVVLFPLFQRRRKIQVISVPVPSTTPRGTPIKFNVRVDGLAMITVRGSIGEHTFDALVAQPPERDMPTPEEVAALQEVFAEAVQYLKPGERAVAEAKWKVTTSSLRAAMDRGDRLQAVHEFEELEDMAEEIAKGDTVLEPPKEEFDRLVDDCRELKVVVRDIAARTGVPYDQQETAASIETQCDHGERAYRNRDQQAYSEAIQMLDHIRRYLLGIYHGGKGSSGISPESVIAAVRELDREAADLVPVAEAQGRAELQQELRSVRRRLSDLAEDVHRDTAGAARKVGQVAERLTQIHKILSRKPGEDHGSLALDHS